MISDSDESDDWYRLFSSYTEQRKFEFAALHSRAKRGKVRVNKIANAYSAISIWFPIYILRGFLLFNDDLRRREQPPQ